MKKKILLIEDDLPTIDVYKIALTQAGFSVRPIMTGQEAMQFLEDMSNNPKDRPDIVLLDIILPDINGLDILKKIRELENTKNLRVLVLTNYTDNELEEKGLRLGAEKYLSKTDFTPTELVGIVKKELEAGLTKGA